MIETKIQNFNFSLHQISVKHQDKSLVLLNDETRWIIVGKIMDRYTINEKVTYYKFELNENGVANVRIPTLTNETKFHLEVKAKLFETL